MWFHLKHVSWLKSLVWNPVNSGKLIILTLGSLYEREFSVIWSQKKTHFLELEPPVQRRALALLHRGRMKAGEGSVMRRSQGIRLRSRVLGDSPCCLLHWLTTSTSRCLSAWGVGRLGEGEMRTVGICPWVVCIECMFCRWGKGW